MSVSGEGVTVVCLNGRQDRVKWEEDTDPKRVYLGPGRIPGPGDSRPPVRESGRADGGPLFDEGTGSLVLFSFFPRFRTCPSGSS